MVSLGGLVQDCSQCCALQYCGGERFRRGPGDCGLVPTELDCDLDFRQLKIGEITRLRKLLSERSFSFIFYENAVIQINLIFISRQCDYDNHNFYCLFA